MPRLVVQLVVVWIGMTRLMARLAGVDGCKGGWVAVEGQPGGKAVSCRRVARLTELLASTPDIIAVDVPIGLLDTGAQMRSRGAPSSSRFRSAMSKRWSARPKRDRARLASASRRAIRRAPRRTRRDRAVRRTPRDRPRKNRSHSLRWKTAAAPTAANRIPAHAWRRAYRPRRPAR